MLGPNGVRYRGVPLHQLHFQQYLTFSTGTPVHTYYTLTYNTSTVLLVPHYMAPFHLQYIHRIVHTLTFNTSIFKVGTIMISNSIIRTVQNGAFSSNTTYIIQEDDPCPLTKECKGASNCACRMNSLYNSQPDNCSQVLVMIQAG